MKLSVFASLVVVPSSVFGLLDQKIKAKGKVYLGSALDPNTFNDGAVRPVAISGDFGAFTPENSGKWDTTEPARGVFNFTNLDALVNFATSNGKIVRGHTLVWHQQLPAWVQAIRDSNTLTQVIQNHIATEVGRYRGRIFAWDVVNEIFNDNGTFRTSVFFNLLGENFVDIAFRAARAADPNAKLYINDFNLDGPGPKIDALIALVGRLKSRGVPIDGIGSQSHLILGQVGGVAGQLPRLAATGLQVALTELDIRIQSPVTTQKLQQQQNDFNTVARACISVPNCVGITVWGISDKNSFVDSTFPGFTAPLLFDRNLQRKPAYNGVDAAFS
ncbi:glycosyl hydrolase family 10 protein [Auricularia subglabra TFB-10046 SS5]|uniref:Beta-xylanase n=1 Tax=Auricularia subglabra (strain TFB-10046 / SS5) TaxID=717982 RepID=J0CXB2_AURST|nr:glycosyl hydrolase family 10 protein [Auricularia subglabra TFB-10046 SS5]